MAELFQIAQESPLEQVSASLEDLLTVETAVRVLAVRLNVGKSSRQSERSGDSESQT